MEWTIVVADRRERWTAARRLIEEYAASLAVDLSFQNIAHELDHLASEYGPPHGTFLLAEGGGATIGCVGVRRFADDAAEVKRLYVVDAVRGQGVGRKLAEEAIMAARRLGYARLLLDTLPTMRDAQRLYLALGFREIPAYRHNPVSGTAFFALDLRETG
jgi:GNAT superfamily N-acetyltransferase